MPQRILRRSVQRAGRIIPTAARHLRGRAVTLKPGDVMPWHSTGAREEVIIVLAGRLELRLADGAGRTRRVAAHQCVFLPMRTRHSVFNAARAPVRYLYITA
ncbi:MAG: cupin domain-containing protein [Candidatus Omnitrophica bacterium]|nr:cupin domain-containing protein [Candidatus Omnitrophota bacterium]